MPEAKRRLDSDAPGDWPLDDLLTAIGEAAYVWDVASDRLRWTSGAREVLGLSADRRHRNRLRLRRRHRPRRPDDTSRGRVRG